MLPYPHQLAFLLFTTIMLSWGARSFHRLHRRIRQSRPDPEPRLDHLPSRIVSAIQITLTQSRTFKKRPVISLLHSFIFYGFVFYLFVNLIDVIEAFFPIQVTNLIYTSLTDILSFFVLLGVSALIVRRFFLPTRNDFQFNPRTLLHPAIQRNKINKDSLIVSTFILLHVGSRALASAAKLTLTGPSPYEPFATLLSRAIPPAHGQAIYIIGFWGALGSVLAFLPYFPYTKHIHIFVASLNYVTARHANTGTIPPLNLTTEDPTTLGAKNLEDLAWPRLMDAYACIQCNRCQDVCPASATGKSLSPAALEINKRMQLNFPPASPQPLLQFALSAEAAWACTTCGACMAVCPTQDEQMLDILDIRRHQVMVEAEFPAPLQTAFRGMERTQNPWGINRAKRMDWAEGLKVPTTAENPTPDVLYWVGCAASYDPSAQKTARAFVQLLAHANVNFAVLGKSECCTGDTARRAGNEYLYRQLADENVSTLNTLAPKLIVASCPHCLNSIANEYKQIGGDYKVQHHTEFLETLVDTGKLTPTATSQTITYHDPCYLGRHNGVYGAPRNLLHILSNDVIELPRNRENAFCCGAGGAQFWKEEEPGDQRIADNRFYEVQQTLESSTSPEKVLAVACPFCKSMLSSNPSKAQAEDITIKDISELLLQAVLETNIYEAPHQTASLSDSGGKSLVKQADIISMPEASVSDAMLPSSASIAAPTCEMHDLTPVSLIIPPTVKLQPMYDPSVSSIGESIPAPYTPQRKKWQPVSASVSISDPMSPEVLDKDSGSQAVQPTNQSLAEEAIQPTGRLKWQPKLPSVQAASPESELKLPETSSKSDSNPPRKKWNSKKQSD